MNVQRSMKTLLFLFLSATAVAQCETNVSAQPYIAIPSFFSLYFNGQCISEVIKDTTICVKVPRTTQGQVAAFSYSSPNGQPAFVTSVKQYDNTCTFIESGTLIPAGSDTITICYDIEADFIDNFCPYTILSGGLNVEWGGVYAYYNQGLHIRFITESNSGTEMFEVLQSQDAYTWRVIHTLKPFHETTSTASDYNIVVNWQKPGINYFCIRERDLNGNYKVSDIVYCDIPYVATPNAGFDILGRSVSNGDYMYFVKPR